MKKVKLAISVSDAIEAIKKIVEEKGFTIFADIDHQANAKAVDLDMPLSRVLIFGNPVAGTALMVKDLTISFDLPLRLAVIDNHGETFLIYDTSEDYSKKYDVKDHPVLEKMDALFTGISSSL